MGAALAASSRGYLGWGQLWMPLPGDIWDGDSSRHFSSGIFGMRAALAASPQRYLGWEQL